MNQPIRKRFFSRAAGTLGLTVRRAATVLLTIMLTTATAWAETKTVSYIDMDGNAQTATATVLTGGEATVLDGGTYVVNSNVTYTGELLHGVYLSTITFTGDATIILADGSTMNVVGCKNSHGITAEGNLTICGQSGGTGTLNVRGPDDAQNTSFIALNALSNLNIGGVIVNLNTNDLSSYGGVYSVLASGAVTISGGQVTACGKKTKNTVSFSFASATISWRKSSDFFYADYISEERISLKKLIFSNLFSDGTNIYIYDILGDNPSGKTLRPAYFVVFDANGGSKVDAQAVGNRLNGDKATRPADPTRTGYTFATWQLDGADYDFSTTVTHDITLTATWTPVNYSITYNLGGGTNAAGNPTSYTIESSTIALADATRSGYAFAGWYDNSSFSGSKVTSIPQGSTGNRTLYARWISNGNFGGGNGTAASPYVISSTAGWDDFCQLTSNDIGGYSSAHYRLGGNIAVTTMAGTAANRFSGTFDGNDKTLIFTYTNSDGDTPAAPFAYVSNATIANLAVTASISGSANRAAGLIGDNNGTTTVTNSRVDGTISGGQYCGGFAIDGAGISFTGCIFDGKITAGSNSGGFCATGDAQTKFTDCLFAPSSGSTVSSGGNLTGSTVGTVSNSYYTQQIGSSTQGKRARTVTLANAYLSVISTETAYSVSGITSVGGSAIRYGGSLYSGEGQQIIFNYSGTAPENQSYAGITATTGTVSGSTLTMADADVSVGVAFGTSDWATGHSGTEADPYIIYTKAQLELMRERVNQGANDYEYSQKYYKLGADIAYDATAENNFTPISPFLGHFDGCGHTVSGIRIKQTGSNYQGFFGQVNRGGVVENLYLDDIQVEGKQDVGSVSGYMQRGSKIINCHVSNTTVSGTSHVGGIVGNDGNEYNTVSAVTGCTSDATVSASGTDAGGIIGYVPNGGITIQDCLYLGTSVTASSNAGAVIGTAYGNTSVSNSFYTNSNAAAQAVGLQGNNASVSNAGLAYPFTSALINGVGVTWQGQNYAPGGGFTATDCTVSVASGYMNADNKVMQGATVTLSHAALAAGWTFDGYTLNGTDIDGNTFTMPNEDVIVTAKIYPDPAHFSMSGDEYTIYTAAGWGVFCDALQDNDTYNRFSGKTVALGSDISVSRMAGGSGHEFCGTFDGQGNTLTVSYANTDNSVCTAPFSYVDGATIQNLIVSGTISGTAYRAAGIIGETSGSTSHITNCVSSVDISSGRYTGGFSIGGNVEIEGCVFNGKINGSSKSGGFVGYGVNTTTITNSLFDPQDGSSISGGTFYHNDATVTLTNCYYTTALGTAQGIAASSTTTLPANIGAAGTDYGFVTAYEHGIGYGGRYYMIPEAVSLSDNATNDVDGINGYFADVTLSGRTLTKSGDWNTLCLPFNLTAAQLAENTNPLNGATIKELDAANTNLNTANGTLTLSFTPATSIVAGKPYIVKWTTPADNISNPVFTGVTIDNSTEAQANMTITSNDGNVKFVGQYSPFDITNENKNEILYVASGNKIGYSSKTRTLKCFRAHFWVQPNGTQQAARMINIDFGEGETTQITTTNYTNDTNSDGVWYTLDGRKVQGKPTQKGMYIVNGQKLVVK